MFKTITDAWIYLNFYLFAFEREFNPASCLLPQLNWIWILNAFCFKSWVMHNPGCYSHFNCHFYHSWRALCVSSHLVVEKQHKTTTPQANMTIERFNLVTFYRNECNGKVRLWKLFGRTFSRQYHSVPIAFTAKPKWESSHPLFEVSTVRRLNAVETKDKNHWFRNSLETDKYGSSAGYWQGYACGRVWGAVQHVFLLSHELSWPHVKTSCFPWRTCNLGTTPHKILSWSR